MRQADVTAQLHLRQADHAGGHLRSIRQTHQGCAGWRYFEIDSTTRERPAPEMLMALLEKIVA